MVRSREPVVDGIPLRHCLFEWSQKANQWPETLPPALARMDDRCVAFLVQQLDWKPSFLVAKLNYLISHIADVEPFHDRPDYRALAATALGLLGSRATNAIPALERMAHSYIGHAESGTGARGAAIAALIRLRHESVDACIDKLIDYGSRTYYDYTAAFYYLGTNAAPVVPLLVRAMEATTDEGTKCLIARALADVHSQPELSVPALASLLTHTNQRFHSLAVRCLEPFGSAARPAWDGLASCLTNSDERDLWNVTNVLRQVDPEAAQRLGVR
jgi:hypothetical protein